MGIHELLAAARARLDRLEPAAAYAAMERGALLIDTRTSEQRAAHGEIPGAVVIGLNVLEWRLDPDAPTCVPELAGPGTPVILLCQQGYSSSLAAVRLQDVGLTDVTDVIGGFEAWMAADLPVRRPGGAATAPPRETATRPPRLSAPR